MSQTNFDTLTTVLEQDDEEFRRNLPAALDGVEDELETLLTSRPEAFDRLSERMSTLDGIAAFADDDPETVDRFLDILWNGLGLITETVPAVREEVSEDFGVNWVCEDAPTSFHMVSDAEAGTISGGPGRLDDAELTFRGPADVMFSMLNDPSFDGTLAYVQNRYEIVGSLERARTLDGMMATVNASMDDLN